MTEEKLLSLKKAQIEFAKITNNQVWGLLDKANRTPAEDEEMLLTAYASLYHWSKAGTAVNIQRGYWMLGKVYISLGKSKPALEASIRCKDLSDNNPDEMNDFDLAFAQELLARAYALSGDLKEAEKQYKLAVDLGEKIQDPEDQKIFLGDLHGGDWFQLIK